jgi:Flp pilus assembly protein TadG
MNGRHSIVRDRRGVSALEFALAAPILILFLIGIAQLGILFAANAGLQHAVDEGARYATVYPYPSDTGVIAVINQKKFFLDAANISGPTLTHGVSNGVSYVDIAMSYDVPLNFAFFTAPPIRLNHTRRAYQS